MFKIYIDYDKLYDICLKQGSGKSDEYDKWYKVLCKQQVICTNHCIEEEFKSEDKSKDNPIFIFSKDENHIKIEDKSDYMNKICEDNSKVLENPCAVFILDISPEKASEIQKKFGVICQSSKEMNIKVLTKYSVPINFIPSKQPNNNLWKSHFEFCQKLPIPSNCLIIVDRYLFSSEYGETVRVSYYNIEQMMEAFMPNSFDSKYHICIIFDATTISEKDSELFCKEEIRKLEEIKTSKTDEEYKKEKFNTVFKKISTKVNKERQKFVKKHNYNVTLELLSCDKRDKQSYAKTHDRMILSNYFYVISSSGFKVFHDGSSNESNSVIKKRKMHFYSLYATELDDDTYSIPVEAHADDIQGVHDIMKEAKEHPTLYMYSINGKITSPDKMQEIEFYHSLCL